VRTLFATALLALLATAPAAAAENLVSGLSLDKIEITSNYAGAEIVVFGAIENPAQAARPDIVVAVRGPDTDIRVRRKGRVGGIWINHNRVILHGMPSYYFVASARPLERIASEKTLRQYGLGLDALKPRSMTGRHALEPFRQALIRHEQGEGLYAQKADGVQFLSGTLFRARVPVPSSAPRGRYIVEVYLIRDGQVISVQPTPLTIDQTGLERRLYDFAHLDPLAYGLSTVLMAVLLGWLSSLAFRRME